MWKNLDAKNKDIHRYKCNGKSRFCYCVKPGPILALALGFVLFMACLLFVLAPSRLHTKPRPVSSSFEASSSSSIRETHHGSNSRHHGPNSESLPPRVVLPQNNYVSGSSSSSSETEIPMIDGRWTVRNHLGSGSFGSVYEAVENTTGNLVAVKLETSKGARIGQLQKELKTYERLASHTKNRSLAHKLLPHVLWSGQLEDKTQVLVMPLYGQSLKQYVSKIRQTHPDQVQAQIFRLVPQMIQLLELVHDAGIIHRDVKPQNFVLARHHEHDKGPQYKHRTQTTNGEDVAALRSEQLHLIDFGLSKRYIKDDGSHTIYRLTHAPFKSVSGTVHYASINSHMGVEQTRRDDLESLAMVLLSLLQKLPWQRLTFDDKDERVKITMQMKMAVPIGELCYGVPELESMLRYVRSLGFSQRPDYARIRKMFSHAPEEKYIVDRTFEHKSKH